MIGRALNELVVKVMASIVRSLILIARAARANQRAPSPSLDTKSTPAQWDSRIH